MCLSWFKILKNEEKLKNKGIIATFDFKKRILNEKNLSTS